MKELIRFYAALAEQYRFVPVLIYVPLGFEIKDFLAGDEQQRFSTFLAETAGEYQDSTMTVIDLAPELKAMGSKLHVKDFYVRPYDGHPSAYGNELIAEVIYERIEPLLADRAQTAQLLVH